MQDLLGISWRMHWVLFLCFVVLFFCHLVLELHSQTGDRLFTSCRFVNKLKCVLYTNAPKLLYRASFSVSSMLI